MTSIQIKKLPKSMAEIEGEISTDDFERHHRKALKELNEKSSIPGFRPGHIPENILVEKIGEETVLEHAAEHALREAYPKILREHKLDAIGNPKITITKMARKNPLGFKIEIATVPELKLPDYKNMASIINKNPPAGGEIKVENKEVDEAMEYLKKNNTEKDSDVKLNDEFAKKFGQPDLDSLKNLLKDNIRKDKEMRARESRRMEIMDKISYSTDIEIPDILIQSEKEKMAVELRSSIENMGMKWDDYLKHIKKSEEELKNEWSKEAERRARHSLILREIANLEKIEPSEEDLNDFIKKTVGQYPETERQKIDKNRLKEYAYGMLRNEKVFRFLENYKPDRQTINE